MHSGRVLKEHQIKDWDIVKAVIRRLLRQLPTVIYPGQDEDDRSRLLRPYHDARAMVDKIEQKISGIDRQ